jgi:hypothetical protein
MKRANKTVRDFGKTIRRNARRLAKWGAVMAGVAAGAMVMLARSSLRTGDELAKTSQKLGVATEQLASLQFAAARTGVEVRTFNMGLQRMVRRIAEAAAGTGEAQEAIRQLGLDAAKLAKLSPDEAFRALAAAMGQVESQGERVRLSFKLFDSEGVALVNTLALGAAGLAKMEKAAKRIGVMFSGAELKKLEDFNDSAKDLKDAFTALGTAIMIKLAPGLKRLVDRTVKMVAALRVMNKDTLRTVIDWAKWAVAVGTVVVLLPRLIAIIKSIITVYRALAKAQIWVLSLSGPKGWALLVGGAIAASVAVVALDKVFDSLGSSMKDVAAAGKDVANSLADVNAEAAALGKSQGKTGMERLADKLRPFALQQLQAIKTPEERLQQELTKTALALRAGILTDRQARAIEKHIREKFAVAPADAKDPTVKKTLAFRAPTPAPAFSPLVEAGSAQAARLRFQSKEGEQVKELRSVASNTKETKEGVQELVEFFKDSEGIVRIRGIAG